VISICSVGPVLDVAPRATLARRLIAISWFLAPVLLMENSPFP
jgi:hypothetical protein